jgi:hypothetical protein
VVLDYGIVLVIDFRYHLVSIIAVFLALAVGLVVGSTALTGKTEQVLTAGQQSALSENHSLRNEQGLLNQQVKADQAFAQASSQRLLADLLTGERVVLVTAPGADPAVATGLSTALKTAGATVTGQVSLTSGFTTTSGQNETELSTRAQTLASTPGLQPPAPSAGSTVPGQLAAAQVLAASLLSGGASSVPLPKSASQAILNGLVADQYITVSGTPAGVPADLAILITPATTQAQSTNDVLMAVAQQLSAAARATVMAGALSPPGVASVISAEKSAGNIVSTVDNADTESGQITVVQALRLLLDHKSPAAFGVLSGVAPSPAPTPSVASVPTTSTSAPAKGR